MVGRDDLLNNVAKLTIVERHVALADNLLPVDRGLFPAGTPGWLSVCKPPMNNKP
jgi:hypothetical protein